MINRNASTGSPMSWTSSSPENETYRWQIGGVKAGFSGHVPRSVNHYGSSHYGGLPFRDNARWHQKPAPLEARRRTRAHAGVNPTSAAETGRSAWNVEWANHSQLLALLRPHELAKYNVNSKRMARQTKGMRNLEAGGNLLEAATGIDLDGDGDVGLMNVKPDALPHRRERTPRQESRHGNMSDRQLINEGSTPLPSYRKMNFLPISRDHATPARELRRNSHGGIKPRYMGFVPKAQFQYGVSHFGGVASHPETTSLSA